jgi:hypothetical protein
LVAEKFQKLKEGDKIELVDFLCDNFLGGCHSLSAFYIVETRR